MTFVFLGEGPGDSGTVTGACLGDPAEVLRENRAWKTGIAKVLFFVTTSSRCDKSSRLLKMSSSKLLGVGNLVVPFLCLTAPNVGILRGSLTIDIPLHSYQSPQAISHLFLTE